MKMIDLTEYPSKWSELVGQKRAVAMLRLAAKSARVRKEPMDHTLIAHPTPGIGKTSLAILTALEMGTKIVMVSGPCQRDKARLLLSDMEDRDVLWYTEFHQVMNGGRGKAEWLLSFLQDGIIMGPMGPEEQPRVTLIADTTDAHKIPENILSRFLVQPPIAEYTDAEAAKIVTVMARKVLTGLPAVTGRDAKAIAAAAANNPRGIKRMLVVLRDMAVTGAMPNGYDIPMLLASQGITNDGLDEMAQRYLTVLATEFQGSAGGATLGDRLQIPGGLDTLERMLMDKGLVAKTRTGRVLTQAGIRRYRELEAS